MVIFLKHNQAFKTFVLKINRNFFVKGDNTVKKYKTPFSLKVTPLYIINKKNNWHCQKQKPSRILLASDFVT